jgi:hypothetical protein
MGSESLLRRRRERGNFTGEETPLLLLLWKSLSRACMARGEIDREDVAVLVVVVFQGLDFLMAELGVLARWMGGLWRRYEEGRGFEGGGGVGEASLGRTQERSWRGRAISTASSISAPSSRRSSSSSELLSEDVVQFSSLSSVLSSAARVERTRIRSGGLCGLTSGRVGRRMIPSMR